jgi:hypothetical protein
VNLELMRSLASEIKPSEIEPYHAPSRGAINNTVPLEQRDFIAWDGEGMNLAGKNRPQSYVLFGASSGDMITSEKHIHTFDLLDLILKVGEENPHVFHVGFAFNYDANMIVRSLHKSSKKILHERGFVRLRRIDGTTYRIQFLPGKWFHVTRYGHRYHATKNHRDKVSVRIYDIFSFFGCSFIKAYEDMVGPIPQEVKEGKAQRNDFAQLGLSHVERYWRIEIAMLVELANALRRNLYGAGFRISQWHGPGALASFVLRREHVESAMAVTPEPVRTAARHAYAGGRFEIFQLGRTVGPIYSVDINSAYPSAIAKLPDLTTGRWFHREGPVSRIAKFGVYRVRLLPSAGGSYFERAPGPLFHRDKMGNISFPWVLDGWYWSPEIMSLRTHCPTARYEIVEGWEYSDYDTTKRPFAFIEEMYDKRRQWKAKGIASQWALKLAMNSIYGKMAQRVGWNEEKRTAPKWHQLEWAGWVTSFTRAILWDVMARLPYGSVLAVETDGLYTTTNPMDVGISNSGGLGEWEVSTYDEILYVQSGMAWLRNGDAWKCKRRGLDAGTFSLNDCQDYLSLLAPNEQWLPYVGSTTRFIGLGAALNSSAPLEVRHCVWQTVDREIRPGMNGKRVHLFKQCRACAEGKTAYEDRHDMCIRSAAYTPDGMESHPHDIPWEGDPDMSDTPLWRVRQDEHRDSALLYA